MNWQPRRLMSINSPGLRAHPADATCSARTLRGDLHQIEAGMKLIEDQQRLADHRHGQSRVEAMKSNANRWIGALDASRGSLWTMAGCIGPVECQLWDAELRY